MEQNNKNYKEKESKNPSINNSNLFDNFPDKSGEKQFAGSSYFNTVNENKKSNSSVAPAMNDDGDGVTAACRV